MGAGIEPRVDPAVPLREDVTLDEIEKSIANASAEQKAEETKKEAEAKVAAEAKAREAAGGDAQTKGLMEALRISEESRKRTEEMLRSVGAKVEEKREEAPLELTKDQLNELFQKDPLAAIEYMNTSAAKRLEENIARRLDPLISGGASSARIAAQAKYPDEFALFGDQIEKMIRDPRVSSQAMNNPQAWDDLIAYIRGQNFEKLAEHRASKSKEQAVKDAQAREANLAGVHTRSEVRAPAPTRGADLDATEQKIAEAIFSDLSPDEAHREYKKYRG